MDAPHGEILMPFGMNKKTGKPGPSPKPPRDGDKIQARQRVNVEVRTGHRPHPSAIPCVDCGHSGTDRRHEYDHHLGYAADHHYHVQSVCAKCHRKRCRDRGELIQKRNSIGQFKTKGE